MHYLMLYQFVPDYIERRAQFRAEHLALAWQASERGELLIGGAFDPPTGAALFFKGESPTVAEQFAQSDPYVRHGLVTSYSIQKWTTVVGELADTPVGRI